MVSSEAPAHIMSTRAITNTLDFKSSRMLVRFSPLTSGGANGTLENKNMLSKGTSAQSAQRYGQIALPSTQSSKVVMSTTVI